MRYLSVCSGIEAATVAWHPALADMQCSTPSLGWTPAAFSEIEALPRSVLSHHYPNVPLHGDFTTIGADDYGPIDLLVGGTPCQSFSIAGLRKGLGDDRGNLALEYLRLADRKRARWLLWENVPGVLSSNRGRDFGTFLGALAQLGYGFAYRVLDAQHFGVPQRRRRVFVVGYLGDWRRAAAVLFERQSLSGDTPPRREKGQGATGCIGARTGRSIGAQDAQCGHLIPQGCGGETAPTLNAEFSSKLGLDNQHIDSGAGLFVQDTMGTMTARMFNALGARDVEEGAIIPVAFDAYNQADTGHVSKTVAARHDQDTASLVAHSLRGEGFDASGGGTGRGTSLAPVAIQERAVSENPNAGPDGAGFRTDGQAYTLEARTVPQAVALSVRTANTGSNGWGIQEEVAHTLDRTAGPAVFASAVRRLTPRECERLQGFPDDYTLVPHRGKPAADGPRYKALGNSMAVPVMRWIGERIQMVEDLA